VKGGFLHEEFKKGEKVYMKVPAGWEHLYPCNTTLLLLRTIYGLKQAAMAFSKKLLMAMRGMGFKRSTADPCLYYSWKDIHMRIFGKAGTVRTGKCCKVGNLGVTIMMVGYADTHEGNCY